MQCLMNECKRCWDGAAIICLATHVALFMKLLFLNADENRKNNLGRYFQLYSLMGPRGIYL